jgi:hypothetical protein
MVTLPVTLLVLLVGGLGGWIIGALSPYRVNERMYWFVTVPAAVLWGMLSSKIILGLFGA